MKIAQIAPLHEAVSPAAVDAVTRVVATLTNALVDLGQQVTLFATADSRTRANLVAVRDRGLELDTIGPSSDVAAHLVMLDEVRRRAWQFDVLHFHIELLHLPMFAERASRTVTTLHGRLDWKDLHAAYNYWPNFPLVSVIDAQRSALPQAHWIATVQSDLPASDLAVEYLALYTRVAESTYGTSSTPTTPAAGARTRPRGHFGQH